jgi:hypothetical protein
MITHATLVDIFGNKMAASIGIKVRRAAQKGRKPARPYATWHAVVEGVEGAHQNIYTSEDKDANNIDVSRWEASKVTVTLTFIADKDTDVDDLRVYANKALEFIKWNSDETDATKRVDGVTMRTLSPSVRSLDDWIVQNYEHKLAFDVRIDSSSQSTRTIQRTRTVELTPTIDGDVKPKIEVSVP